MTTPSTPPHLTPGQIQPTPTPTERHAQAIAEVQNMRDTIRHQVTEIDSLTRALQTERDRVILLMEERARWRTDAMACRTFVTKLATILEYVNSATLGAGAILDDMARMDSAETPKASVDETSKTIEENLRKMRELENAPTPAPNPVSSLPEGTLPHS